MKKTPTLLLCFFFIVQLAKAGGGPDAYGYTWITSQDGGGPTFNWIDIASRPGVQTVTGLADDNSAAGMVNIGFQFPYYWSAFNQLKVGSNGWLSFNSGANNIASCFPGIPTAGGAADNYLAPYMSDLNFTGGGNPGQVKYWTNNVDSFIISYINVPFWTANSPGWFGSNNVQVILCKSDSSITFQYGTLNSILNNAACIDMVVGIEAINGTIGLQTHADISIPQNYTIRYNYPPVVLLSIQDLAAKWNDNDGNKAIFVPTGNFEMKSNISNAGNTDVSAATALTASIRDLSLVTVGTDNTTLPGIATGGDTTVVWPTAVNVATAGSYYFETTFTNPQDINAANNTLRTEVDFVDLCTSNMLLGYVTGNSSQASTNWNGGANDDGMAVHIVPPTHPVTINNMQVFVTSNVNNNLLAHIYADDGPNGTQGTLLYSGTLSGIASGAWNTHTITPVTINSGGFYLAFFQTGTNVFIGTQTIGPISRRNYEILDGSWAAFRYTDQDIMIRCSVSGYPQMPDAHFTHTMVANTATFDNNTLGGTSTWHFGDGATATTYNAIHTYAPGVFNACLVVNTACSADTSCVTIVNCAPLTPTISGTTTICGTSATTLDAGPGYVSYSWSTGATTQTITVSTATTVSVTVTDANGCTGTGSETTTILPALTGGTIKID